MIAIPISAVIGFALGYWFRITREEKKDAIYKEIVEDIKAAKRMGYEYVAGRWQKKGV